MARPHTTAVLTPEDTPLILGLYEAGLSSRQIAEKFDVSSSTIRMHKARLQPGWVDYRLRDRDRGGTAVHGTLVDSMPGRPVRVEQLE